MENKSNPKKSKFKKRRSWTKGKNSENYRESDGPKQVSHATECNDPKWYMANNQLAKDVASFSFNTPVGGAVTLDSNSGQDNHRFAAPGIMSIYTAPAIGVSGSDTFNASAVNVATRRIYTYVRHANSGHANYDAPDLMMYLLAMDSIYTYWAWMARIYGYATVFSQTNRYIGDALITSNGVDPTVVRRDMAQFRSYINNFAVRASNFCVPNVMTYFTKHLWMYSEVYRDEDVAKSQLYQYVPAYLYQFQIDGTTGAGKLVPTMLGAVNSGTKFVPKTALSSVTAIRTYGDALLSAVFGNEDFNIMSGDILKAYGYSGLVRLVEIPDTYAIVPKFSEEMLKQFHNTNFVGAYPVVGDDQGGWHAGTDLLEITQNTGVGGGQIVFAPMFDRSAKNCYSKLLDFWTEEPTPEDCLVASRNMLSGDLFNGMMQLRSCGSELAFFAAIVLYNAQGVLEVNQCYDQDTVDPSSLQYITKFNQAPIIYSMYQGNLTAILGEISNYTVVGHQQISDLNDTALLSLFQVPYDK